MESDSHTTEEVLRRVLAPGAFALVVVDKQNAYFSPESSLVKARSNNPLKLSMVADKIDDFLRWFREASEANILWVRMDENIEDSPVNIKLKQSTGSLKNISKKGEMSFEYIGENPVEGELEFAKDTYDIFGSKEFSSYVAADKNIKTLVLVGGLTSRCILASAFAANSRGYNVVVLSDLVGVPDKLEFEEKAAFSIIDSILGYMVESEKLKELISIV